MVHRRKLFGEMTNENLFDFIKKGNFEVHMQGGEIMSVGLKWGDSRRLVGEGIPRDRQIAMLDWLEVHPQMVRRFILHEKVD
jgi:hypothetical protein